MTDTRSTTVLRLALLGDALASGAVGLAALLGAGALVGPLGLPAALLKTVGLVLLPYAAGLAWLGSRERPARTAVLAVVAANALWVVESLAVAAGLVLAPTALGSGLVALQAAAVAGFAAAQAYGLRHRDAPQAARA
jgi:hypothetical protein